MKTLVIEVSDDLAARLKVEKQRTGCPVSEQIRRAVTASLPPQEPAPQKEPR